MNTTQTERLMALADAYAKAYYFDVGGDKSVLKREALLAALQAREGEAVAPSAILARGRFHAFKGEDGEPDDWEWFEEGTNCEHGCIDAVIVRADAIAAPQPAQPVALPLTDKRISRLWSESHNDTTDRMAFQVFARAIEAAHGIGGRR